jgi:hypothetical protein
MWWQSISISDTMANLTHPSIKFSIWEPGLRKYNRIKRKKMMYIYTTAITRRASFLLATTIKETRKINK